MTNKEYTAQLLQRFMNGETTEQEEQYLADYFSHSHSIPQEWEAYSELFASFRTDAYGFTEEEQRSFIKETPTAPRIVKLWPWLAAACVAALMVIFLTPPREEAKQVAMVEKTIIQQKEVEDSVKAEPISQPMQEEKQLAQVSKRNSSDVKRNRKKAETIAKASQDAVAVAEISSTEENYEEVTSVADQRMEEFYASSANIHRCGQQLKQRVATMLADQQTNPQYVNL